MSNEWLIWSNEHGALWAPNSQGYTRVLHQAGRYSEDDAKRITDGANRYLPMNSVPNEIAIRIVEIYYGDK